MSEHLEIVTGPVVTQAGTTSSGSPIVTGLTTAALQGAVGVSGAGIPAGTFVRSIDSAGQVTLTANATAAGSTALTFRLEPVTLLEAKRQCKQDAIDDDDPLIAMVIGAARIRAEVLLRQTILTTTYDLFMDGFPATGGGYFNRQIRQQGLSPQWLPTGAAVISLPKPPLVSVESVKYLDSTGNEQTVDPSTYRVSTKFGSRIQPRTGNVWPVTIPELDSVTIRFTAGYPTAADVSENTICAMLLMIGHLYEHREEVTDFQTYPLPRGVDDLLAATDHGSYA